MARALCVEAGHDPDVTCDIYVPNDPVAGHSWAGYRGAARAAIKAMRELTHEMLNASAKESNYEAWLEGCDHTAEAWNAMIDEALK